MNPRRSMRKAYTNMAISMKISAKLFKLLKVQCILLNYVQIIKAYINLQLATHIYNTHSFKEVNKRRQRKEMAHIFELLDLPY